MNCKNHTYYSILILLLFFSSNSFAKESIELEDVSFPSIYIKGLSENIELRFSDRITDTVLVKLNNQEKTVIVKEGEGILPFEVLGKEELTISFKQVVFSKHVNPIPHWLSIIPPLIAILIALIFKEVYLALFIGIFSGAFVRYYYVNLSIWDGLRNAFLRTTDSYIPEAILSKEHVYIILFSMLIGGVVSVISKNGGMMGFVNKMAKYANSPLRAELLTWAMGLFIFFDDYANTLVVGNTMRPVTDRFKISREKLAYIVDSTAAPIASIALVTTWIGAELSYIEEGIKSIGLDINPYSVFLHSLKYAFYPIVTLAFVLFIILSRKDFGPMYHAEHKARNNKGQDKVNDESIVSSSVTSPWWNGVTPIVIIIIGTLAGLVFTGLEAGVPSKDLSFIQRLSIIIGNSDSYRALLWSSMAATGVALLMSISQKLLSIREGMSALIDGYKSMLQAVLVLILAWALSGITQELRTADFISNMMLNMNIAVWLTPAIVFLFALIVSFATGSSWGTMAILYPLMIPASWMIGQNEGLAQPEAMELFFNVVSCVLAGSVLGDHISPISDTTIMSSLASSCNHISHVRTQTPYALMAGFLALFLGTIPAALGVSSYILFPLLLILAWFSIKIFGKKHV